MIGNSQYVGQYRDPEQARHGMYLDDAFITPFVQAVQKIIRPVFEKHVRLDRQGGILPPLNKHRLLIPDPILNWDESCGLVYNAFNDFDPWLGTAAKAVLDNPARWILAETSPGDAWGRCCSADCPPLNHEKFAVITYHYDRTINDPVYIAHEMGHLLVYDTLADTIKYPNSHMKEVQAYFTQHILYAYLLRHEEDRLKKAGARHFIGEIIRNMYGLAIGSAILAADLIELADTDRQKHAYARTLENWLGNKWQCFERATTGIERIADTAYKKQQCLDTFHGHCMAGLLALGLLETGTFSSKRNEANLAIVLLRDLAGSRLSDVLKHFDTDTPVKYYEFATKTVDKAIKILQNE